jgi:hypothetical protein
MHAGTVSLATVLGQRPGWIKPIKIEIIETGLGLGHRPIQPNVGNDTYYKEKIN